MKIEDLFADVLKIPRADVSDTLSMDSDARWDSVRHFALISAMEKQYAIKFSTEEIYKLKSLPQARELLIRKGVDVSGA